jgi:putative flavoprotein involved in K+ transport
VRAGSGASRSRVSPSCADYLEVYARRFELPVRTGVTVEHLRREEGRHVVRAGGRELEATQVLVAMANYQRSRVPGFARELRGDIVQLHSREYRSPSQLREGDVLLVGAGNSGSEIAMKLARRHRVFMSGRRTGHVPFRIEGFTGRVLLVRLVLKGLFHHVLTVKTPIGRKVRPTVIAQGGPLIRVKPRDLAAAGVERVPRTAGVEDGRPRLEDGRVLDVANVVWCTGFAGTPRASSTRSRRVPTPPPRGRGRWDWPTLRRPGAGAPRAGPAAVGGLLRQ